MKKALSSFLLLIAFNANAGVTIMDNVHGYTSTNEGIQSFSSIAFDDAGRIVGTDVDVASFDDAAVIDGQGRVVLPGLTDAHAHVSSLGVLQVSLDLFGVDSLEEAVTRIADFAANSKGSGWVKGRGWNQVLWEGKEFPTAADIDAVVADRPVWLRRVDGHAGWANTKALELAGIDKDTPDPVGGKILRDDNGNATGVLIDKAMYRVEEQIPAMTKDELRVAYDKAIALVNSLGITGVHDAGISKTDAEVLISMADEGKLNLRFYGMVSGSGDNLDAIGKPLIAYGNDRLDIRSVKLYQDGALGSRGAAMIEPYSDDPENYGLPFWTQDELDAKVAKANRLGFQVGVHAIGDKGNQMVLNSFDKVQGGEPSELRNRVEHSQIVTLQDIPRFAELGVIASMQPVHATSDMNMAEDRVGPERIKGAYAWRKFLEAGVIVASGSDFPVELANPFHGLYAAVSRQDRAGMPEGGWYAEEVLTRAEALHSFTLDAAYAALQEDRLGSLEAGKWADFIVIDRDYFEVDVQQIDDIEVIETWIGGQKVYDREAAE
ncbi:MAG: amidohydrolase [Woeseiaceae bacterium]|nr:amidohydrolase [Woeseiaceae bacterium]